MTILFLCSGNIHRSAHAEAILRRCALLDGRTDLAACSAGVVAVDGMPAAAEAIEVAEEAGVDLSAHRSRAAGAGVLAEADRILVMESYHLDWLERNHPTISPRARLLTDYGADVTRSQGVSPGDDLPDAIGGDHESFRRSFLILDECVRRLYRELPEAPQEVYAQAIESRFRVLRRGPMSLSPADYALVERWWNEGVPLWIVLGALEELSRRQQHAADTVRVRRLAYIESEVEERFGSYRRSRVETQAATATVEGDSSALEMLAQAASRLKRAADAASARGLEPAGAIYLEMSRQAAAAPSGGTLSGATAALRLHAIEDELMAKLTRLAPEETRRAWRDLAEAQLCGFRDRMIPDIYEATVERLVAEHVRAHFGMPTLT